MLTLHSTSDEFQVSKSSIAVIGVGALEQHGPHLPIETDLFIAELISERVAANLHALLLPAIPFSMSECHGSFSGTISLKPETLAGVIRDIIRSLAIQGITNILIINCHGGNIILGPVIQELHHDFPLIKVHIVYDGSSFFQSNLSNGEEWRADIHAGNLETSIMLHYESDLVHKIGEDYSPPVGREFLDYVTMPLLNPQGIWGYPQAAETQRGGKYIEDVTTLITSYVRTFFGE